VIKPCIGAGGAECYRVPAKDKGTITDEETKKYNTLLTRDTVGTVDFRVKFVVAYRVFISYRVP
jgi:hypothetical protein